MYIPEQFKMEHPEEIIAFVKAYSFGVLTSIVKGRLHATHIPFTLREADGKISFTAHLSKFNPQWQEIESQEILIVFNGPHAYISPNNYTSKTNVPTWNYLAVHMYGKATIVRDTEKGMAILEKLMLDSEASFLEQWKELPQKYIQSLYNEIVPLEIEITEINAKKKLSQNKSKKERENIINYLKSNDEAHLAQFMQANEGKLPK